MSRRHPSQSHDFTQVVKEIPTLIVEEIRRNKLSEQHETKQVYEEKPVAVIQNKPPAPHIFRSPKHSKQWMIMGVIICSASIFGFWFVYISDLFYQNKSTLNPTTSFTKGGSADVSMMITTFSKMEQDIKSKLKSPAGLKAMIGSAILPFITASSTPTSTPNQRP